MLGEAIYRSRCQGKELESRSLQNIVRAIERQLGLGQDTTHTVQEDPGRWLVVADARDPFGVAIVEFASATGADEP